MSLKAFHILFIAASIALSFGFGIWSIQAYASRGDGVILATGILSLLAGLILIRYAIRFVRKLRHVRYL